MKDISKPELSIAENYVQEAQKLLLQNKIKEASAKYHAAVQEYAKIPEEQKRSKINMAHFHFYNGLSIYMEMDMAGVLRESYIKESLESFEYASKFYSEVGNNFGVKAANGWAHYMSAVHKDFQGKYKAAKESYEKAWRMFRDLLKESPEAEMVKSFVSLAERGVASSMAMQLMSEDMRNERGGIIQALDSAKNISSAEYIPYWDGLKSFFTAQMSFWDGVDLLDRWDCGEARKMFMDATKRLDEATISFSKLPKRNEKFDAMVKGYQHLNEAEKHTAEAIACLLEKGSPSNAKREFILVIDNFKMAEDMLGNASMTKEMIKPVRNLYDIVRQRAHAVSNAYGIKNATIGVGKWFAFFFFLTFTITTLLKGYLDISGSLILEISLIVGIITAFGLKSPEIFVALKKIKLPKS